MCTQILIVDDHELVRVGLRLRLGREEGLKVVADAADAASAHTLIAETSPDVVVMDLDLPGEDGLVATTAIKARWPNIRVLALTGSKPVNATRAALLAGADGLVFKSEASDDLVRAVRTLAAGKVFLSPDAATALTAHLRESSASGAPGTPGEGDLSPRERSVLKGLAEGLSYKELAADLGVSVKSVDTYRAAWPKSWDARVALSWSAAPCGWASRRPEARVGARVGGLPDNAPSRNPT